MTTDKQIEVIEGNKLIAEFMGARKRYFLFHRGESSSRQVSDEIFDGVSFHAETYFSSGRVKDKYIRWQYHKWQMSPTDAYGQFDNWLKYHTSWDWQIPAWSKVCHVVREIVLETITYKEWYFKMLDAYGQAVFSNNPKEGQEIIIEMIQWYNQHSKPQTI